jgi:hypothetical protein
VSGLQRLIITFKSEELVLHALYRSQDSLNPGTKARRRQVEELVREGLRQALVSLEGGAEVVGTSGYDVREDVLLATTSSDALETVGQVKGA